MAYLGHRVTFTWDQMLTLSFQVYHVCNIPNSVRLDETNTMEA